MALSRTRGGNRFSATIWPGFVDAMTALLMVLMFVITIFMVVQSVLRETVDRQESALDTLGEQVAGLTSTLSVTQAERAEAMAGLADATARIGDFEARIDQLLAAQAAQTRRAEAAETARDRAQAALRQTETALVLSEETLETTRGSLSRAEAALIAARGEVDAQAEEARLAAARREALEALTRDLEAGHAETREQLAQAEAARLADAAAAEALRARLREGQAELTAMTLSLEESRREAEETLTLLAAAEAARAELGDAAAQSASEAARQAALLALAQERLAGQQEASTEAQRRVALLNEQVAALNTQLASIQAALDISRAEGAAGDLRLEELGAQLNAALLQASDEQRRRLALEEAETARLEAERTRLEEEAADLARYRSEFFGRLSQILQGREGVAVVGDRFVFQSEVLFGQGEASLSPAGQTSIARVTDMLAEVATTIPAELDWVIRVDGHTDATPLSGSGRFRDNWELSQARALAVVRYMIDDLGFPADRLAPTGFADTRPVAPEDTPEGRALNRRIELKLTER